jgi:hypothetical protein
VTYEILEEMLKQIFKGLKDKNKLDLIKKVINDIDK